MNKTELPAFRLIGLALPEKTTNTGGQAAIDCGNTWQAFTEGSYATRIPGRIGDEIFAVYHDYESDHLHPYAYFIGCKVAEGTEVPEGFDSLLVPAATYTHISAKGKMPECIGNAWKEIWNTDLPRAYQADFEVYGARSVDWNNAEVEIFLSIK